MARWQANPQERLVASALDLFAEKGYENTTVIEIAQRAGLTKSTFFRHFPDKREVLFGGDAMATLLADAIVAAPAGVAPLDAVAHALDTIGREVFTAGRRGFAARRSAVIAATPELQEREALKALGLTAAIAHALKQRGVPELEANVAAQLAALTLKLAYERWISSTHDEAFSEVAMQALRHVQAATPTQSR
ncbi:MAG TPA: helix-turn-helix domain-containing protein [Solirubrobacteraceae bacterium]|nr:helix-turn-helix domain-containing protein [Solirubrobacteraceae bacterium]